LSERLSLLEPACVGGLEALSKASDVLSIRVKSGVLDLLVLLTGRKGGLMPQMRRIWGIPKPLKSNDPDQFVSRYHLK
jgi:hypothetical protein